MTSLRSCVVVCSFVVFSYFIRILALSYFPIIKLSYTYFYSVLVFRTFHTEDLFRIVFK